MPVVEMRRVFKVYSGGATAAVADLNLTIREGEFFSILGSSGSGKTTTLRMIAGFEQPTRGQVFLAGKDVSGVPPYRREVNTVFQNYALFPHMNVKTNVGYPLKMAGVKKAELQERVADALAKVNMAEYTDRLPHALSGGQKQRVALARALVGNPKLLLLDEPLGALDQKLREQMLTVLKHLQREIGITFIYVTHDQGEALAMSDRVAVMNAGKVEQIGTPVEVYTQPASAFVASFIGKTNLIRCTAAGGATGRWGDLTVRTNRVPDTEAFAVSIRPEAIVSGPESRALANYFEAIVQEVIYFGFTREVTVRAGDSMFSFRSPDFAGRSGETVEVGFPAEAAVVVVSGASA